ncbi:origin recognition complex subunit 4 [Mortierella sp. AD010]|nr:origin recognition complex subunit 4 [Mortierella sp. AD010]
MSDTRPSWNWENNGKQQQLYLASIVRQALQDIEQQFRTKIMADGSNQDRMDIDEEHKEFMVIHLNGLVQTDDRMALKEIMRQLSREGEAEMDGSNYYTFPPSSYHDYVEICENTLSLSPVDLDIEIEDGMLMGLDVDVKEKFIKEFNHRVKMLFDDGGFAKTVQRIFDLMKDVRGFYRLCFGPVAELSEEHPYLLPSQFYESGLQQRVDNKTELLKGISLLELSLLIAIKHLVERETVIFNFEMVYDEYKDFMDMAVARGSSASSSLGVSSGGAITSTESVSLRLYKKAVALKAFEHLVEAELLRAADNAGKGPKEYRMMRVMLDSSQISDIVLKHRDCPTVVARWAARRQ